MEATVDVMPKAAVLAPQAQRAEAIAEFCMREVKKSRIVKYLETSISSVDDAWQWRARLAQALAAIAFRISVIEVLSVG